jgi:hypothetical protein
MVLGNDSTVNNHTIVATEKPGRFASYGLLSSWGKKEKESFKIPKR